MEERIKNPNIKSKVVSPEEAAQLVRDGMFVGMSGFTIAGYPKAVPEAMAERAKKGDRFKISLITGASVGNEIDGLLTDAGVISRRYPYQTNASLRDAINKGTVAYCDIHLSQVSRWLRNAYLGKLDLAIIEASSIDENGNIYPTMSVGCSNTLVECAERVIVEINTFQATSMEGFHDICGIKHAPETSPIPINSAGDRIGTPYIPCAPEKIAAVVYCGIPDSTKSSLSPNVDEAQMAAHLVGFLKAEIKAGRLPSKLPPLQSGIGGVANAVLTGLKQSGFSNLEFYSEVLQDTVLDLIEQGIVSCASATSLHLSPERREKFIENIDDYKGKIVLRPVEISNSPEVIRRLGVIAVNTAIEADLSGNINSTHINGIKLMNGIGGSGDFARNGEITIFTTASTAKNGTISCIVPFVTHTDHTEHDVMVIITEQGYADLRGLAPYERARQIIENCAHPKFRPALWEYVNCTKKLNGHGIPIDTALWKEIQSHVQEDMT